VTQRHNDAVAVTLVCGLAHQSCHRGVRLRPTSSARLSSFRLPPGTQPPASSMPSSGEVASGSFHPALRLPFPSWEPSAELATPDRLCLRFSLSQRKMPRFPISVPALRFASLLGSRRRSFLLDDKSSGSAQESGLARLRSACLAPASTDLEQIGELHSRCKDVLPAGSCGMIQCFMLESSTSGQSPLAPAIGTMLFLDDGTAVAIAVCR